MARTKIAPTQIKPIAFKARRATSATSGVTTETALICDSEYYDHGSCYDTSTGLFTAPYTGIYSFKATAYLEGSSVNRAFFASRGTASLTERPIDVQATAAYRMMGVFEVAMTAGQTFGVSLWTSHSIQLNNQDTMFCGHLVAVV